MKQLLQIFFIVILTVVSKNVIGQKDSVSNSFGELITVVEEQPGFPGGEEARKKYFHEHAKPPDNWRFDSISGKVFVTFIVHADGNISNARILRGLDKVLDSITIAAIIAMPKWIPAKQRGTPVDCSFNLPIPFGNQPELKKGKTGQKKH
jgi:TonB family protein